MWPDRGSNFCPQTGVINLIHGRSGTFFFLFSFQFMFYHFFPRFSFLSPFKSQTQPTSIISSGSYKKKSKGHTRPQIFFFSGREKTFQVHLRSFLGLFFRFEVSIFVNDEAFYLNEAAFNF